MPTWRIPLSAHVCTTDNAPAIDRADIFLVTAQELLGKAQVLLAKYQTLKPGPYCEAVWSGHYALEDKANERLTQAISRGALLHFGCPQALAVAQISHKLHMARLSLRLEAQAC